ncbi:hypothetical protein EON65_41485 [archaeon]|nr:MAG: hypothetical protein EON65_41485 [archaeon]
MEETVARAHHNKSGVGQINMTSSLALPKVQFTACDETSLKLHWDALPEVVTGEHYDLRLQYKQAMLPWEQAKECSLAKSTHVLLTEADVVDLEPGTPYSLRLMAKNTQDGSTLLGPEVVFDTKPIDCTPKRKRCVIS